jgi:hypothetical protein
MGLTEVHHLGDAAVGAASVRLAGTTVVLAEASWLTQAFTQM